MRQGGRLDRVKGETRRWVGRTFERGTEALIDECSPVWVRAGC